MNIRLINAEPLLDKTTTDALAYLESGEDFNIYDLIEDIEELKSEMHNQFYHAAINDVIKLMENKIDVLFS